MSRALAAGLAPPLHFNESLTVFPPKGEDEDDANEITRDAQNTRPISLKNTDNKLICQAFNRKADRVVPRHLHPDQRGFVKSRHFIRNIIGLDSHSRINSMAVSPASIPVLTFFDFAAAFPSVAQRWLLAMLEAAGFPTGFVNLVKSIYFMNVTFFSSSQGLRFLFWIHAGV